MTPSTGPQGQRARGDRPRADARAMETADAYKRHGILFASMLHVTAREWGVTPPTVSPAAGKAESLA